MLNELAQFTPSYTFVKTPQEKATTNTRLLWSSQFDKE